MSDEARVVWTTLLDEFESVIVDHAARLDALDDLLLDGLPRFSRPDAVPPIPADLRPRATELVRRNDALAARVAEAAARVERTDVRVRAVRAAPAAGGFDELA